MKTLLKNLVGNNEFFALLLSNSALKKKILDAFKHSVYEELRKD